LACGEEGLAWPSEWRFSVGQLLGGEGIFGNVGAAAVGYVGKGSNFKEDSSAIDVVEIVAGEVR
jgi:hypothetical protein